MKDLLNLGRGWKLKFISLEEILIKKSTQTLFYKNAKHLYILKYSYMASKSEKKLF